RSIFVLGTVTVTKASLPTRCAWIMATAAGMRTIGASGGPFFPHATKATNDPQTIRREDHDEAFRTTKTTKNRSLLRDLRAVRDLRGLRTVTRPLPPVPPPSADRRQGAGPFDVPRPSAGSGARRCRDCAPCS